MGLSHPWDKNAGVSEHGALRPSPVAPLSEGQRGQPGAALRADFWNLTRFLTEDDTTKETYSTDRSPCYPDLFLFTQPHGHWGGRRCAEA